MYFVAHQEPFHFCVFVCTKMIFSKFIDLPCFSSGIHEEIALSGEDSYNDRRSENGSKEHGSGLDPSVSTSMSVQVCYQGPDFSGSKELTFTLASSDDQTAQVTLCYTFSQSCFCWLDAS